MAFKIASAYIDVETRWDKDKFLKEVEAALGGGGKSSSGGESVGKRVGRKTGKGITDGVEEEMKRGGPGIKKRFEGWIEKHFGDKKSWRKAAAAFGTGFIKAISLGMANPGSAKSFGGSPVWGLVGAAIAATIVTGLIGGLTSTLSAMGGIGLIGITGIIGGMILMQNKKFKTDFIKLKDEFLVEGAKIFAPLAKPLLDVLRIFTKGMVDNAKPLQAFMRMIAPAFPNIANGIVGFMKALGPGLTALGQVGVIVSKELLAHLPQWGRDLGNFFIAIRDNWPGISESLHAFFTDMRSILQVLGEIWIWTSTHYEAIRDFMKVLFSPWTEAPKIPGGGNRYLDWLKKEFSELKDWVGDKVKGAMDDAKKKVLDGWNSVVNTTKTKMDDLKNAITQKFQPISNAWNSYWDTFGPYLKAVWGVLGAATRLGMKVQQFEVGTGMRAAKAVWNSTWAEISSKARSIWKIIGPVVKAGASAVASAVKTGFNTAYNWVSSIAGKIVTKVRSLKSNITSTFSGAGDWLANAGRAILQGLIDGITFKLRPLAGLLDRITNMIPKRKGPMDVDKRLLTPNGEAIMDSLMVGFENKVPKMRSGLDGITSAIPRQMARGSSSISNNNSMSFSGPLIGTVVAPPGADPVKFSREMLHELDVQLTKLRGSRS